MVCEKLGEGGGLAEGLKDYSFQVLVRYAKLDV